MFARLILALLLMAFAMPGLVNGPCHDAPAAAMPRMDHGMTGHGTPARDDRMTVAHCLGCIPPASLATRTVDVPPLSAAVPRRIVAETFDPASGMPPALPPPRRDA